MYVSRFFVYNIYNTLTLFLMITEHLFCKSPCPSIHLWLFVSNSISSYFQLSVIIKALLLKVVVNIVFYFIIKFHYSYSSDKLMCNSWIINFIQLLNFVKVIYLCLQLLTRVMKTFLERKLLVNSSMETRVGLNLQSNCIRFLENNMYFFMVRLIMILYWNSKKMVWFRMVYTDKNLLILLR